MCSVVFEKFPDTDLLAGVATAGVPWGAMASDQLKLPFVYVRPSPKGHGLGNQIEGFYEKGQKVVVIEDLISTGKSSLQVIELLRQEGLDVQGMVAIFTYNFPVAEKAFSDAGVPYITLTNYSSLIQLAEEKEIITAEQQNTLLNWRVDPANWNVI
jgi:orotate phosphoribosyltransferase